MALVELPDELLLMVLVDLDSARDFRALGLSCRRFHRLVGHEGWRAFVTSKFSSLSIPSASGDAWRRLAELLTWQTRCWDRRAIRFTGLLPDWTISRGDRRPGAGAFLPVVDAHICPQSGEELLVWGAGENIVARRRQCSVAKVPIKPSWSRLEGSLLGYSVPGYDDVSALAIVDQPHNGTRDILAGRVNGDLSLLSAQPDRFGKHLANFDTCHADSPISGVQPSETIRQSTILSLDVLNGLVAASTKENVTMYRLPQNGDSIKIAPLEILDPLPRVSEPTGVTVANARWMGDNEVLAVALRGSTFPLRYLTGTPNGWSASDAAKNADLEKQFDIDYGRICPNSIQPVKPHANTKGGTSLLLSSWRDGSCRLQDLRTPSPFDTVYHDNISPADVLGSLLTYGTERFIAGTMDGAIVKIFDFRWTKGYYHTAALPCGNQRPFPAPYQPFSSPPKDTTRRRARCDRAAGRPCRWHELSRDLYYRPNVNFYLTNGLPRYYQRTRVCSLAKASDVSSGFYIGISGGVVEASLGPPDGIGAKGLGLRECRAIPSHCGYKEWPVKADFMETGDGLSSKKNHDAIRMPYLGEIPDEAVVGMDNTLRSQHRLDSRYHTDQDVLYASCRRNGLIRG